ncbi:teneurin [Acrasis kona]|uniref:Teneurin n=1 Tax=Acrasis kona TaxID=1008807 RepID=A0AAW2Z3N1_9EUKA
MEPARTTTLAPVTMVLLTITVTTLRLPSKSPGVCSGRGYCSPPVLKKYGPFGAGGGNYFSDVAQDSPVDKMLFWGGSWQDSCQFGAGNYTSPRYPTAGGGQRYFALQKDETFTSVTMYSGGYFNALVAQTSFGRSYSSSGATNGNTFTYNLLQGETIYGFFGYIGGYVYSLGFYVQQLGTGCICNPPYYGPTCNLFNCFGKNFGDPTVCSSGGNCTAADTCVCNPGYSGRNCEIFYCSNRLNNATSACSGRLAGTCASPDNCVCNPGYTGTNCEIYYCNNQLYNTTGVCGSRGTCVAPYYSSAGLCVCPDGYGGPKCDIYGGTNLISVFPVIATTQNAVTYSTCCSSAPCSTPTCYPDYRYFGPYPDPQQVLWEHPPNNGLGYHNIALNRNYLWFSAQVSTGNKNTGSNFAAYVYLDGALAYTSGTITS